MHNRTRHSYLTIGAALLMTYAALANLLATSRRRLTDDDTDRDAGFTTLEWALIAAAVVVIAGVVIGVVRAAVTTTDTGIVGNNGAN